MLPPCVAGTRATGRLQGRCMIVRAWRGRTESSRQHLYPDHFKRTVLPELKVIEGFVGASLSSQQQGAEVEFMVLTRWTSMDAIRAFAGEDVDKAVVEPAAMAALTSYDRTVCHYTVLDEIGWVNFEVPE